MSVVLMLFAAFSLLMHLFKMGYYVMMKECKPVAKVLAPFIEAPFLGLQVVINHWLLFGVNFIFQNV